MKRYDEDYVQEILSAAPPSLTRDQFQEFCRRDVNGGWRAEVLEAQRRYFKVDRHG